MPVPMLPKHAYFRERYLMSGQYASRSLNQSGRKALAVVWAANQKHDAHESHIKRWLERGYVMYRYVPDLDEEDAQLVLPKTGRRLVLAEYHDSELAGHYGVARNDQQIASRYYWSGMHQFIAEYASN
ncbi:hypothetical protein JTB14_027262 [Gonioctena quinquepunctata]|nr:hypothetical protein JTB14_027262 [Gonioctena quinquepunctata]